jgi:hypothetical protein
VIFKLHPSENAGRARREIERYAPNALIFETGNTIEMIANCATLVTRYSSVLLFALGLNKPVFCDLEPSFIDTLRPVQNKGTSAKIISEICLRYL